MADEQLVCSWMSHDKPHGLTMAPMMILLLYQSWQNSREGLWQPEQAALARSPPLQVPAAAQVQALPHPLKAAWPSLQLQGSQGSSGMPGSADTCTLGSSGGQSEELQLSLGEELQRRSGSAWQHDGRSFRLACVARSACTSNSSCRQEEGSGQEPPMPATA